MKTRAFAVALTLFLPAGLGAEPVFIAGEGGIYALVLDPSTGVLEDKGKIAEVENPTSLALHPGGRFVYCTNNDGDLQLRSTSHLIAYYATSAPGLVRLNAVETRGTTSTSAEVDPQGRFVLVANYDWGALAAFPIEFMGRLGVISALILHEGSGKVLPEQSEAHPYSTRMSPDARFIYVPDFGTDEVFIYTFNAETKSITPAPDPRTKVTEGSGPRQLELHPALPLAYLVNELGSTLTVFDRDVDKGTLLARQTVSTIPARYDGGNQATALAVHPQGKFVYVSNSGSDSIAVYAVGEDGVLKLVEHTLSGGRTPSHLAIDATGAYLLVANEGSGVVTLLGIDAETGKLKESGQTAAVPSPRYVLMGR